MKKRSVTVRKNTNNFMTRFTVVIFIIGLMFLIISIAKYLD